MTRIPKKATNGCNSSAFDKSMEQHIDQTGVIFHSLVSDISIPKTQILVTMMTTPQSREEELTRIIHSLMVYNQFLENKIKALEKTCEQLRDYAIRDGLTGLFNRRYMEETLIREIHRCLRRKSTLGIIMIDVDHFKWVNDRCGHLTGDNVLKSLAFFLDSHIRGEDIACRYGGEEFILIMPDIEKADLFRRADQLRREIHDNIQVHHGKAVYPISVSMGLSLFPDHGTDLNQVLKMADQALYHAKKMGRNRVVMADASQHEDHQYRAS